ncbi:MAG: GNAT family N-acetyltransferase [Acidobacteriota bacterium]
MTSPRIELVDDFRLSPEEREEIRVLLAESFPEEDFVQTRTYLKQVPTRRLLARDGDRLVAHAGVEHRVVGTESGAIPILGLIEVCVTTSARGQGLGSHLVTWTEELARENDIEFLVLFAADHRLYERLGFQHETNVLRWAMIHEHQLIGLDEQPLDELMVKPLSDRPWPGGTIDLLGYQF